VIVDAYAFIASVFSTGVFSWRYRAFHSADTVTPFWPTASGRTALLLG